MAETNGTPVKKEGFENEPEEQQEPAVKMEQDNVSYSNKCFYFY